MTAPLNHPAAVARPRRAADLPRRSPRRAASRSPPTAVFRTPSAVSMQIKKLEEMLGRPVFSARRALGVADHRRRNPARLCAPSAGNQPRGGVEVRHAGHHRRRAARLARRLWRARAAGGAEALCRDASGDRGGCDHRPDLEPEAPAGRAPARPDADHFVPERARGRRGAADRAGRLGRRQGRLRRICASRCRCRCGRRAACGAPMRSRRLAGPAATIASPI